MRQSQERRPRESNDPYYDLFEDWDLIVSSFLSQYGLRIRTREFETVSWDEFRSLLAGISPDTVLGRVVEIRSETDEDMIKRFTRDQKRIYDDWRSRRTETMSMDRFNREMESLERTMADLFGGGDPTLKK